MDVCRTTPRRFGLANNSLEIEKWHLLRRLYVINVEVKMEMV